MAHTLTSTPGTFTAGVDTSKATLDIALHGQG